MRVLVVDDDADVRQVIRWMLEVEGAIVLDASSGLQALDLARTKSVDVALTDLGLPDMSGEAVISGLRALSGGRIPVAVVSGARLEVLAQAVEIGTDRAFTKPVNRGDLIQYLAAPARGRARGRSRWTRHRSRRGCLFPPLAHKRLQPRGHFLLSAQFALGRLES